MSIALAVGLTGPGLAQDKPYPTKSITYPVTFDPGGQSDSEARRQQPRLEKRLGQKVIVDYKVGGGGALGWSELVRSQPDGCRSEEKPPAHSRLPSCKNTSLCWHRDTRCSWDNIGPGASPGSREPVHGVADRLFL